MRIIESLRHAYYVVSKLKSRHYIRGVRLAKKWLWFGFLFSFAKNCGLRFGFTKLSAVSVFSFQFDVDAILHLRLYHMMLEMMYFRAELAQLTVSRSESELEVQRYGTKKNTLTVDPNMLQDELWMRQCEKSSPNRRSRCFENRTAETEFLNFEVGLVFRKPMSDIFIGFHTPLHYMELHIILRSRTIPQNTDTGRPVAQDQSRHINIHSKHKYSSSFGPNPHPVLPQGC